MTKRIAFRRIDSLCFAERIMATRNRLAVIAQFCTALAEGEGALNNLWMGVWWFFLGSTIAGSDETAVDTPVRARKQK